VSTVTDLQKVDAIAIGGFDGMHIGHQHLFDALGDNGAIVVIETGYANLTPGREREHYTHHPIVYYPLDDIKGLEGEAFIAKICQQFPSLKKIVVGYDFHFGKDRHCSHKDIERFFDGEVCVIEEVCVHNDSVHSHKIRTKLKMGELKGANHFLGHNYTVRGKVIRGQGLGKSDLVPTVNIDAEGFLLPEEGVYATLTQLDNEEYYHPSVSFVGHRITTDGSFAVETHIIGEEIGYCTSASISFVKFIRANQRFDTLTELKKMIDSDIEAAKLELEHLSL